MDMQGSRALAANRQQAWEALNDPEVLKACIPGCDRIETTGPNAYAIGMSVKVGPVSAKFTGKIQLEDVNPPESYTLKFEGQGGAAGFGKGTSQVKLEERPIGCELTYTVNAQVGGKIAQVGQRLIDGVARSMAEDFFKRFEGELEKKHGMPVGDPDATMPLKAGAPAAAAPAPASSGGVPVWVWVVGGIVLVGALALFAR